jgi:hypothetical protein
MAKLMLGFVLVLGIIVSQGVTASAQRSVVGYWKTGGLGMINEVNTVTGQTKNNRGKTFSYIYIRRLHGIHHVWLHNKPF